jgi:hypothetical protein
VTTYNHSPSSEACPYPYRVVEVRDDPQRRGDQEIIIVRPHVPPTHAHETLGITSIRTEAGPLEVLVLECGYLGDELMWGTGTFFIKARIDPDGERTLSDAYRAPEAIEDEGPEVEDGYLERYYRGQIRRQVRQRLQELAAQAHVENGR